MLSSTRPSEWSSGAPQQSISLGTRLGRFGLVVHMIASAVMQPPGRFDASLRGSGSSVYGNAVQKPTTYI